MQRQIYQKTEAIYVARHPKNYVENKLFFSDMANWPS